MSAAELPPFQSFVDEHGASVLGFLRAMVGSDDADDCLQETLVAALRAYPRAEARNMRAWVLMIARRKAIDHHRARARRPEPVADPRPGGAADPRLDGVGEGEVWARVAELANGQRTALALRYAADLPYREIAAALGCSEAAARRRVHDGLDALRAQMQTTTEEER